MLTENSFTVIRKNMLTRIQTLVERVEEGGSFNTLQRQMKEIEDIRDALKEFEMEHKDNKRLKL